MLEDVGHHHLWLSIHTCRTDRGSECLFGVCVGSSLGGFSPFVLQFETRSNVFATAPGPPHASLFYNLALPLPLNCARFAIHKFRGSELLYQDLREDSNQHPTNTIERR